MGFELHFVLALTRLYLHQIVYKKDFGASFDLVNSKSNTSFTEKKDEEFISNKQNGIQCCIQTSRQIIHSFKRFQGVIFEHFSV